jgi:hypothetical protein
MEVRTAHKLGKHMLFFVERNVHAEYDTFDKNEERAETIRWSHVDNIGVFKFIQEVRNLQLNNAIFPFDTSQDIVSLLREQLAGLFQTLLQRRSRSRYESHVDDLIKGTRALTEVVNFLQQEKAANQDAIREILFTKHPVFKEIQALVHSDARIYFETLDEAEKLLPYFGFRRVPVKELSKDVNDRFVFWMGKPAESKREYVGLARVLFDEHGRLKPMSLDEWREEYIATSPRAT